MAKLNFESLRKYRTYGFKTTGKLIHKSKSYLNAHKKDLKNKVGQKIKEIPKLIEENHKNFKQIIYKKYLMKNLWNQWRNEINDIDKRNLILKIKVLESEIRSLL